MNLTSFFANKCFEYLLHLGGEKDRKQAGMAGNPEQASGDSSRSSFLPPWVENNQALQSACDGCGKCIAGCENSILFQDPEGYPRVDFSGGFCSFCGKCAESCPRGVFDCGPSEEPWKLQASITLDCLTHNNVVCRTCVEHCEEEAIILPRVNGAIHTPRILAERCNGCGGCYSPCPVGAIKMSHAMS